MTVDVECPGCGNSYRVKHESIGARAQCKSCGNTFTLSISLDDTSGPHGQAAKADRPLKERQQKQSSEGTSNSVGPTRFAGKSAGAQQPKSIGSYAVERKLGAGAMGVVYLGRDKNLERDVAIKVLPAVFSEDEEHLKRFLREARLAARLHHTNTATVYRAGADGGQAYIAMEYVEGTALDAAITKNGPMSWREATRVIRDAAAGLGAAHGIGLVHRDIKPGNLIRTPDGITKVVDFGLARGQHTNTQLTQQGTLLGTPAYMAPEQWSAGEVDARSDLYSLTCAYYFLLTGKLAFDAPSLPALGYQHRYEPFPDPREVVSGLPDEVCRILARGSAKEPSDRYQAADELTSELDLLLACPDATLTFGTPWSKLAGPIKDGPQPADDPPADDFETLESLAPAVLPAVPKPSPEVESTSRLPLWAWIAGGAGVAVLLLLLLGILMLSSTKYGTVQITLDDVVADVEVTLDGETISVEGLDEPLELEVGEHELEARSPSSEAFTQSFQVERDETTLVEISLKPKESTEEVEPAVYRVTLDPPEATLAANGEGVSVAGQGTEHTVRVADPDGQSKVILVATLDGYQNLSRELQPKPGDVDHLQLRLELTTDVAKKVPVSGYPELAEAPKTEAPGAAAGYPGVMETPDAEASSGSEASSSPMTGIPKSPSESEAPGMAPGSPISPAAVSVIGATRTIAFGTAAYGTGMKIVFSSDGSRVAVLVAGMVGIWDTSTGHRMTSDLKTQGLGITSIALSGDGKRIVTAGTRVEVRKGRPYMLGRKLVVPTTELKHGVAVTWDVETGRRKASMPASKWGISSGALDADGSKFVTGTASGIVVWDADSGNRRGDLRESNVDSSMAGSVIYSLDGRQLLVGHANGSATLWNATNRKLVHNFRGHSDAVGSVDISPDGQQILTGSQTATILWNANNGQELHRFPGMSHALAFSPDGRRALVGVQLWDTATGEAVGSISGLAPTLIMAVAFTSDDSEGCRILLGTTDGVYSANIPGGQSPSIEVKPEAVSTPIRGGEGYGDGMEDFGEE